jgi:hypothetical protein
MSCTKSLRGGSRNRKNKSIKLSPSSGLNRIKVFNDLEEKNIPKKGTHFSIEQVDVLSDDANLKGNLIKKYINSKLVEQKFVTEDKMRDLVEYHTELSKKPIFGSGKKRNLTDEDVEAIAKAQNKTVPPTVAVQHNTSFLGAVKTGAGFELGAIAINGILSSIFDD